MSAAIKTSVISHPAEMPLAIIRMEYLMITCGDHCAAALLNVFEHWHNTVGKDNWIKRTVTELSQDMLGLYGDKKIREMLKWLKTWGLLEYREIKGIDKTKEYRLRIPAVQSAITLAAQLFKPSSERQKDRSSGKKTATSGKKTDSTYKEIFKENPPAGAGDKRDLIWETICLGSFGKTYSAIPPTQNGRVGRIKKELLAARPGLTAAELEAAYKLYAKENPDILKNASKRLKSPDTILDWIQQAIDAGELKTADTRTPEEIRAGFSDLQRLYAHHFPNEPLQLIEAMKPGILRLQLNDLNLKGAVS